MKSRATARFWECYHQLPRDAQRTAVRAYSFWKSDPTHPGGSIFIHGDCVTIGCLPMTNDKIKEIYIYAIQAHQAGQIQIPVYIFPFKMSDSNMQKFKNSYKSNPSLIQFWEILKKGYDKFDKGKEILTIQIDASGNYLF